MDTSVLVRADPTDSQHLLYNYVPSLSAGIVFLALFGLSTGAPCVFCEANILLSDIVSCALCSKHPLSDVVAIAHRCLGWSRGTGRMGRKDLVQPFAI